ncbi:pyridoxal-dependent decarboxylase, exosortase A system-associated [Sphingobium subterraneum]|uniref:Diaminopimelate decarboxylase n=1 Tax=Sphingobium subterraneum TaxID=627688 RepID=A0A841IZR0_9SPHN|nr:pyridoxal-dependent decarboxylase, exosortase A system-associated [Sphingobium subterraneum]MBB6122756.1 diaminopimelate decarboxylase [Sphingobium subterraneum]
MKPTGPIPDWFAEEDGMLLIGGCGALSLIDEAGDTPLFVYDMGIVRATVDRLRAAMPEGLDIHYAIKANPYAPLLGRMVGLVDGFDVASAGELDAALKAGMRADAISFAGPGKRDAELRAAIQAGVTINLESEGEAERALRIGAEIAARPRLAVRVNPDFDLKGSGMKMGGGAKPFGVDADRAAALARRVIASGAEWRGWHIFAGSQALNPGSLIEAQAQTLALAARLSEDVGASPPIINLGGGFGVAYFPGDMPLDPRPVGVALEEALENRPSILKNTHFAIELGRFLVAESGVYLTRVIDVKDSHGERFAVVDGGLHHQLAASGNFGTVVRRNYPIAVANRFGRPVSAEPVSVVGCLCTPLDRLGDKVVLPPIEVGDVIALFLAGAYGASASPAAFLGHDPARELLLD